ncbi:SCP-like extracellular protein [Phytophthora megakarya]|uniref:SCP-like extracellular protein n=1 Tax=Phytophthora megakarya TaxID=4795 RepID=A0A225WD24_9STRA|nr:SCP-like extracellular protein [Phytophthora megakarya]
MRQVQRSLSATYAQSSDMLSAMLARVNKERANANLPPVCANRKLQSSSQRHSDDMAQHNYMAHDGSDGSTMSQRITEAGYKWSAVGENVAAGQVDVQAVMDAWMESPEHRENILGEYAMLGATYAFKEDTEYKHYWTQDFGKGDEESCDSSPSTGSHHQEPAHQTPDQEQTAQNDDQVQGEADPEETPVPKTSEVPETPRPQKGKKATLVQKTEPTPERSADDETPGKVTSAKDCNSKF